MSDPSRKPSAGGRVPSAPLSGLRVLVGRSERDAAGLVEALAGLGAEVRALALTRIEPLDQAPLRAVLARVREFGWVLFTSRNAVRLVVEALDAIGCAPAEALAHARLGAVGPGTAAALESAGLRASIVPERHQAEGLLEALASGENSPTLRGARVLYPVAEGARDVLRHGLAALGAEVAAIPIYRSAPDPVAAVVREWIAAGSLDLAVLAAPSAVRALVEAAGSELARRLPVAAIGAVTGEAARALGLEVIGEGREATAAGVAEAIVEWARGGTAGRGIRPTGRGGGPPPIER